MVSGANAEFFGDGFDDVGTTKAEFYVDGVLSYTDINTSGHYHYGGTHNLWNTTALTDGPHTVKMVVYDTAGQTGFMQVNVTVNNGARRRKRGSKASILTTPILRAQRSRAMIRRSISPGVAERQRPGLAQTPFPCGGLEPSLAPATGSFTFYTTTDDGVRLWVNGQLLINRWVDQSAIEWSGSIALEGENTTICNWTTTKMSGAPPPHYPG